MSSTDYMYENEQGELVFAIPDSIVEELGLNEDTEFEFEIVGDELLVIPKR